MLRAENNVIGISSNVYDGSVYEYYAKLDHRIKEKTLPSPGNWDFVSIENIVALKPDLVIIWASQSESIEAIESKGIPVYGVMLKSVNDIYKEISDLGKITGNNKRADTLIEYTKNELKNNSILCSTENSNKPKVYFMWPQGPLETSGKSSTVNELIELAGASNVCTSADEHLVVNLEKVIEWNPDIIVMWNNENKSADDILKLPGWSNIKAIKDKRVFELPSVFLCDLWTLKFQYAVKLLSSWCYPAKFNDTDLEKAKKEMLEELYRK
jgi:iron complex transport system substrate-binding protein